MWIEINPWVPKKGCRNAGAGAGAGAADAPGATAAAAAAICFVWCPEQIEMAMRLLRNNTGVFLFVFQTQIDHIECCYGGDETLPTQFRCFLSFLLGYSTRYFLVTPA